MFPAPEPPSPLLRSIMGAVEKADLGTITHPSGGIPMGTPADLDGGCGIVPMLAAGGSVFPGFPGFAEEPEAPGSLEFPAGVLG